MAGQNSGTKCLYGYRIQQSGAHAHLEPDGLQASL